MNYELAKQLKEAGFPDDRKDLDLVYLNRNIVMTWKDVYQGGRNTDNLLVPDEHTVKMPSLSELIEACGDVSWKCSKKEGRYFVEFEIDDGHGNNIDFWLPTLEEVFAKLWLELQVNK